MERGRGADIEETDLFGNKEIDDFLFCFAESVLLPYVIFQVCLFELSWSSFQH